MLNWAWDELILVLDLYFREQSPPFSVNHPDVIELSRTLRSLPLFPIDQRQATFRNPSAVDLKLKNFLYIDSDGSAGLSRYSATDKRIYEEFAGDRDRLAAVAVAIRRGIGDPAAAVPDETLDDVEAPEGRILLRLHRVRERSQELARKRKQLALRQHGALQCAACGFDFKTVYGDLGDGFIECHHTVPVSQLRPGQKTKVSDLALVCANCHRMLHRGGLVQTIEALKVRIRNAAAEVQAGQAPRRT